MLTALIGFLGVCIGAIVTWLAHREIRKDKFKEIIYEEKLAVYKKLLDSLWQHQAAFISYRLMKDAGVPAGDDEHAKQQKFIDQAEDFPGLLAGNGHIITKDVGAKAQHLWFHCMKSFSNMQIYGRLDREMFDELVVIKEKHEAVAEAMRKELKIAAIEKAISKTLPEKAESPLRSLIDSPTEVRALFSKILKVKKEQTAKDSGENNHG
jgi:hypothetical protein